MVFINILRLGLVSAHYTRRLLIEVLKMVGLVRKSYLRHMDSDFVLLIFKKKKIVLYCTTEVNKCKKRNKKGNSS